MINPGRHKEFIDRLRGLSVVKRWNFHPSLTTENVAEHSYYVAIYAWLFATMDAPLDQVFINRVVMHALFHDVEEALTGDLPMLVKRMLIDPWKVIEWYAFDQLTETLPTSLKNIVYRNKFNIKDNEVDSDIVHRYVKAGDIFDVLMYCRAEAKLGNTNYKLIEQESVTLLQKINLPSVSTVLKEYGYGYKETNLPEHMTHL